MRNANRAHEEEISVTQRFGGGLEPTVNVGFSSVPGPAPPISWPRTDLVVHLQSLTSLSTQPTRAALEENSYNGTCEKVTHLHPKIFFLNGIELWDTFGVSLNGKGEKAGK